MSYEGITNYLRQHNAAVQAGEALPDIGVLPAPEAARVAHFLVQAGPVRMVTTARVSRETTAVSTPALSSALGGENMARLETFAARLEPGITQGGER